MSFKYCNACGHKNEFLAIEPKFCSNCGAELAKPFLKKAVEDKIEVLTPKKSKAISEDETDANFVPNIRKLQYDVSPFDQKTFRAEDIFNLPKDGEETER